MDALDTILKADDLVAVLGRRIPVRLVDISASGCLLESGTRLEPGVSCILRVSLHGVHYADDVRVVRCVKPRGASGLYQLGAEFLWTSSPGRTSMRRVVPQLRGQAVVTGFVDPMM